MAFFTLDKFNRSVVRSPGVDPVTLPQPVNVGTIVISSDGTSLGYVTQAGHLGGDNFDVQFTAGSNLVVIPNNVGNYVGLKLFSPQFPFGITITSKTANYREYTIQTAATVTRRETANFCYIRSTYMADLGNWNTRTTALTDANLLTQEGSFYVSSTVLNTPLNTAGFFVEVMQSSTFITQVFYANRNESNVYIRRSNDNGATWTAFGELVQARLSWTTLGLVNSYTQDTNPLQYAVQGNLLHLRGGVLTPGGSPASGQTITTLPSAARPSQRKFGTALGTGTGATTRTFSRIEINTDGTIVNSFSGTIAGLQFDGVYTLT